MPSTSAAASTAASAVAAAATAATAAGAAPPPSAEGSSRRALLGAIACGVAVYYAWVLFERWSPYGDDDFPLSELSEDAMSSLALPTPLLPPSQRGASFMADVVSDTTCSLAGTYASRGYGGGSSRGAKGGGASGVADDGGVDDFLAPPPRSSVSGGHRRAAAASSSASVGKGAAGAIRAAAQRIMGVHPVSARLFNAAAANNNNSITNNNNNRPPHPTELYFSLSGGPFLPSANVSFGSVPNNNSIGLGKPAASPLSLPRGGAGSPPSPAPAVAPILIIYGSESGTAKGYALGLARELALRGCAGVEVLDPSTLRYAAFAGWGAYGRQRGEGCANDGTPLEPCSPTHPSPFAAVEEGAAGASPDLPPPIDTFCGGAFSRRAVVVFIVATYGEGGPCANYRGMHDAMQTAATAADRCASASSALCETNVAVFGLGSSAYRHFCRAGAATAEAAERLGAHLLVPTTLADGHSTATRPVDDVFDDWQESLIESLEGLDASNRKARAAAGGGGGSGVHGGARQQQYGPYLPALFLSSSAADSGGQRASLQQRAGGGAAIGGMAPTREAHMAVPTAIARLRFRDASECDPLIFPAPTALVAPTAKRPLRCRVLQKRRLVEELTAATRAAASIGSNSDSQLKEPLEATRRSPALSGGFAGDAPPALVLLPPPSPPPPALVVGAASRSVSTPLSPFDSRRVSFGAATSVADASAVNISDGISRPPLAPAAAVPSATDTIASSFFRRQTPRPTTPPSSKSPSSPVAVNTAVAGGANTVAGGANVSSSITANSTSAGGSSSGELLFMAIDVSHSQGLSYEAGDHLSICPRNDRAAARALLELVLYRHLSLPAGEQDQLVAAWFGEMGPPPPPAAGVGKKGTTAIAAASSAASTTAAGGVAASANAPISSGAAAIGEPAAASSSLFRNPHVKPPRHYFGTAEGRREVAAKAVAMEAPSLNKARASGHSAFPAKVSLLNVFEWYLDISGPPKRSTLRTMARCCRDPAERQAFMAAIAAMKGAAPSASDAAQQSPKRLYDYFIAYPSCVVPLDLFLEACPRIQPRRYSIASDSLRHPNEVHIVAKVVPNGLATRYLDKDVGAAVATAAAVGGEGERPSDAPPVAAPRKPSSLGSALNSVRNRLMSPRPTIQTSSGTSPHQLLSPIAAAPPAVSSGATATIATGGGVGSVLPGTLPSFVLPPASTPSAGNHQQQIGKEKGTATFGGLSSFAPSAPQSPRNAAVPTPASSYSRLFGSGAGVGGPAITVSSPSPSFAITPTTPAANANATETDDHVYAFVTHSDFHLPPAKQLKSRNTLLIGPGTGIAPLLGFIHRRLAIGLNGGKDKMPPARRRGYSLEADAAAVAAAAARHGGGRRAAAESGDANSANAHCALFVGCRDFDADCAVRVLFGTDPLMRAQLALLGGDGGGGGQHVKAPFAVGESQRDEKGGGCSASADPVVDVSALPKSSIAPVTLPIRVAVSRGAVPRLSSANGALLPSFSLPAPHRPPFALVGGAPAVLSPPSGGSGYAYTSDAIPRLWSFGAAEEIPSDAPREATATTIPSAQAQDEGAAAATSAISRSSSPSSPYGFEFSRSPPTAPHPNGASSVGEGDATTTSPHRLFEAVLLGQSAATAPSSPPTAAASAAACGGGLSITDVQRRLASLGDMGSAAAASPSFDASALQSGASAVLLGGVDGGAPMAFGYRHASTDTLAPSQSLPAAIGGGNIATYRRESTVKASAPFSQADPIAMTAAAIAKGGRRSDQPNYVQSLLRQEGAYVLSAYLLSPDGCVYICGDALRMARDVRAAFVELLTDPAWGVGMAPEAAEAHLTAMERQGRYLQDIW